VTPDEPTLRPLSFHPTPRLRRLGIIGILGLVALVATAQAELAAIATAPLVLLALARRSSLPRDVDVRTDLTPVRCVEGDEVSLRLELRLDKAFRVEAGPRLPQHMQRRLVQTKVDAGTTTACWCLVPARWGRWNTGPLRVRIVSADGLYAAVVDVPSLDLSVYPASGTVSRAVAPRKLPSRFGEHVSRAVGAGSEFAGVRSYAYGDRQRDIDWRTSARQQQLMVRQYAAERTFDLVLLLDVASDVGDPTAGATTLDLTVRAATGLAHTYLRSHDRVGLVTLGGTSRWLAPAAGARQVHRITEAVMEARGSVNSDGSLDSGLGRVPRQTLQPGSFVCVLTPLLDEHILESIRSLHERGLGILVIDVLNSEPLSSRRQQRDVALHALALRVWRLERRTIETELTGLGIPLVRWDGAADLSRPLDRAMRGMRTRSSR
jgi:uncharacterized protein (DUF58 family)